MPSPVDIAILTESRYEDPKDVNWYVANILEEAQLLIDALAALDISSRRVDWSRADVDWGTFKAAVFRTTWDYFERFDTFDRWLRQTSAATTLINPEEIIRWNMDKHYLRDLEAKGVAVVPTQFVERGQRRSMASVMREMGWDEAVIKPAVSGAARHTYRVDLDSVTEVEPIASRLLGDEALMVQPFQRDIIERGEVTLVVIGGKCTHGLIKVAKAGDFRVQDDHGGTVHAHEPSAEEVAFAERAIASCAQLPAYGRVDMVRDNSGALAVMELELVEPELWFRLHPPAAEALAEVIAARIER